MASVSWPTEYLPKGVLLDGYKISQSFSLARTPMEGGLARQRRRFSSPPVRVPVQWIMTASQLAFFKSWLAHKAAFGGAFFSMELIMDEGLNVYDVRFVASGDQDVVYVPISGGQRWRVQATIEVKLPTPMSAGVVDILLANGLEGIREMHTAVTSNTPLLSPAIVHWSENI